MSFEDMEAGMSKFEVQWSGRFSAAILFIGMLLIPYNLFGQFTGRIAGAITDPQGANIPAASVTLTQTGTNLSWNTSTSDLGAYEFLNLGPGTYEIGAGKEGFRGYKQTGITLEVGHSLTINVSLQLGAVTQSVTVKEEAPLVDTQTASVQGTVDSERMEELPLNGRNALQLQTLLPGVVDTGSIGQFGQTNDNYVFNGARNMMVNYLLDGADNVDAFWQVTNNYPNPDALQEFTAKEHNYSAVYGRNGGAVVEAAIRSGTNQFHGDAYEFLRNTSLDARNFFSPVSVPFRRNQYGLTAGGPIKKGEVFGFFSWQGTKVRGSPSPLSYVVPTASELQGNFSDISTPIINPQTGTQFPGNIIPSTDFSPVTQAFMAQFPIPAANGAGGLYTYSPAQKTDLNEYVGRIDAVLSSKDSLMFHTFWNKGSELTNWGVPLSSAWFPTYPLDQYNNTLRWTHSFSGSVVNAAMMSYIGANTGLTPAFKADWRQFGANINDSHAFGPELMLSVSGYFGPDVGPPTRDHDPTTEWEDVLSIIRGRHSVQTGFSIYRNRVNQLQDSETEGIPEMTGLGMGNAFAEWLVGYMDIFEQYSTLAARLRQTLPSGFVQDDIKISKRLTLNVGLRYDPYFGYKSQNGQLSIFEPGKLSTRFPNVAAVLPGMLFPGDPGIRPTIVAPDLANWAPRVGFAWDPTGKTTTSVRGAYGIFYDPMERGISLNRFTLIQPFQTQVDVYDQNIANPWLASPFNGVDPFPHPPVTNDAALRQVYVVPTSGSTSFQPDFTTPYNQQWNLSVQHQIGGNLLVTVAYIGMKGTHLYQSIDMNPAVYTPGTCEGQPCSTEANTQQRLVYPWMGRIEQERTDSYSNSNQLQITVEKRMSHGFTVLSSYAWGHTLGLVDLMVPWGGYNAENEGGNGGRDPKNWALNYGNESYDVRQNWVTSFVWDLPKPNLKNAFARQVVDGWELTGIQTLRSGLPFTVASGVDNSLTSLGNDTANVIGTPSLTQGSKGQKISEWFNTAAFAANPIGTFGTVGINTMVGPSSYAFDMGLFKNFQIRESQRLQFRCEAFNLFNHAALGNPDGVFVDSTFGQILSAGDPRVIEFALKYFF
jgi:hypothetical protein